jgi:gliding motility-associated-like protein
MPDWIKSSAYQLPAATLNGSNLIGAMTGEWNVIAGTGIFADDNASTTAVSGLSQGQNIFTWTVNNGPCSTTVDTSIIFIYNPFAAEAYAGEDVSICSPQSTFGLQAQNPDAPGVGTWALVSGAGSFDDVNNPNATVSGLVVGANTFSWTVYNGPCEAPTTDEVTIFVFDQNAQESLAGEDVELCLPTDSYQLQGNEPIYPAVGTWTIVQGFASFADEHVYNTSIDNIAVGENIFEWTIDNGVCENGVSSDQVSVFLFDDEAPLADAGSDQSWCTPVSSTTMTALIPADPGYGTWTLVSGCGTISDVNDPSAEISGLCVGENIFSWTVYNGPCDNSNSVDFVSIFIFDSTQGDADAGEDQEFCTPQITTSMNANSIIFPAIGTWSLIEGSATIVNENDPNTDILNLTVGHNVFVWTVFNGPCANSLTTDTVVIDIFDQLAVDANAGPDQEFCLPQTAATMLADPLTGAMTGEWNVVSGSGIFADNGDPQTDVSGLSQGLNIFTWTLFNGPCGTSMDTTRILIFNNNAPSAFAGNNDSLCSDISTYILQAAIPETPGMGTWAIIEGSGSLNSFNDPNAEISGLIVGETKLTWTVYNGPCEPTTTDTVSIFIYDEFAPEAWAGDDVEMCLPENSYSMISTEPVFPAFGTWTLIQGSADIDDENSSSTLITNLAQGENIFVWTIDNGVCPNGITQDTVSVFVFSEDEELAFAGEDQSLCEPVSSTFMSAQVPGAPAYGTWQLINGCGNIVDPNNPNSEVTDLCVGENIFAWTVYNGPCINSNTVDFVSIFLYPNTQADAFAGDDQQLCTPITTTQLNANPVTFPAMGTWSIAQGSVVFDNENDPNAVITNAQPGVNILVWTIDNGTCENALTSDTVLISVFNDDLPEANAGPDQEYCLPQTEAMLDAGNLTGAATGLWTLWQGGGNIETPTSDISDVTDLLVGENIFVWSLDNGACGASSDTISVFIFNPDAAVANAGPDASFCTPVSTYTLQANTPDTPGVGTWTTVPTGVIHPDSLHNPNATATGLTVGETVFIWSIYNGPCEPPTVDLMSVFIFDEFAPNADAGPDQEICLPVTNAFMNASEVVFPAVGSWMLVEGSGSVVDFNSPTSEITGLGLGTNCFVWTINNGPCPNEITSDTVCIHVFNEDITLPNAGPDQNICTPSSTVTMSANLPAPPGSAYWTLVSGSGVIEDPNDPQTEITGLAVGINVFTWTFYNGPCTNALPTDTVVINVFDQSQEPANAGIDQEICLPQNVAFMNGNVPTVPAVGQWTLVQGSGNIESPQDPFTLISDLGQGVNCFVWTINNGPCLEAITSDTICVLVFDDQAPLANAGEDIEICTPEDCVILNASLPQIPGYGTWSVISGSASIDDLNDPSAQACNLTVGLTQLLWTVYNGPCANSGSTDTLSIFVFDGTLEGADAGDDVEFCSPEDTYVLQANAPIFPATGFWTIQGPGAIDDPLNPNATVTGLEIGETTLYWTLSNGPCGEPSVDDMKFLVFDPDSPDADAGEDQALCDDMPTITLNGNTPIFPAIGTWTLISGSGDITNANDPNTTVENVGYLNNVFVWTIYNGACPNGLTSDTVTVFVNSPTISAANAGADTSFCGTPGEITLNGSVTLLSGTSTWTILQGGGDISDINNNNPQINNIPVGINQYLYTVDNGVCGITTDTLEITVFDPELPMADAGLSITICQHEFTSTNLSGSEAPIPASSIWSVLDGPGEIADPDNPDALVTSLGEIIVPLVDVPTVFVYTVNNGVCGTSSDTVMWILQDCLTIEIPDAFSPNGDGTNDTFVIPNLDEYPKNRLEIFNRWGAKIYEASPYLNDWDGRSEHPATIGEELPVSTYYYVLDLGTGEEAFHGFIYLKR